MNYLSLIHQPSLAFLEKTLLEMGYNFSDLTQDDIPQEDYVAFSKKHSIFVVADGVTLIQNIIDNKKYPNPSPAGDVARIFSETFVKEAEIQFESFDKHTLEDVFDKANMAVKQYQTKVGRTKETVDYWDTDFFAATAAFCVIKDDMVYWGSICDSYLVRFDSSGTHLFQSPHCHELKDVEPDETLPTDAPQKVRAQYAWRVRRNGINTKGERIGYGVITGEEAAKQYLNQGQFSYEKGDVVVLLTDGFAEYLPLPDFFETIQQDALNDTKFLSALSIQKAQENPDDYGHERSLIAISL